MKLTQSIKVLEDIHPTQEILNYNFTELISNTEYSYPNMFPTIFGNLRTYGIVSFPAELWKNETQVRSNHRIIRVTSSSYPNKLQLHTICLDNVKKLEEYYNGIAKIAVLDILPPMGTIKEHVDISALYTFCHRVHLPLVTNGKVFFHVAGRAYNMTKGKFFEFDNKELHAVQNFSNETRIHLVVDLLPKSSVLL